MLAELGIKLQFPNFKYSMLSSLKSVLMDTGPLSAIPTGTTGPIADPERLQTGYQ